MSGRFPELTHEQMSEAQRAVAAEISAGPRGGVRGPFIALLHHPELARRVQLLGEHLRFGTGLAPDLVELVVLFVARSWSCQYEWYAHARIAREKTDLSPEIIDALASGAELPNLRDDQRIVYTLCRDMFRKGAVDDAVFDEAAGLMGRAGVLDVLALCGYYSMLAMVLNAAQIPLPAGVTPPLQPSKPGLGEG